MKNSVQIRVKNACEENFDNFKATTTGGFCENCQKEVVDFTKMSNQELIDFFSMKTKHICGRLKASQLNRPLQKNTSNFLKKSIAFASVSLMVLATAPAVQAQPSVDLQGNLVAVKAQNQYVVKGTVLDDQNLPLPGVNVVLKGTTEGVVTDYDGKFEFSRKLQAGDVLIFSYIGYDPKEYKIKATEETLIDITIQFDASDVILMGDIAVEELYSSKKSKSNKKPKTIRKK